MPFQVSPGVNVTEYDLTSSIPSAAGTFGAIAGEFDWGPVGIAQPISSELKLVERFGKPPYSSTSNTITDFFTAASFLQYSGSLIVSRAAHGQSNNATSNNYTATNPTPRQVKNSSDYIGNPTIANTVFAARYAGTIGNNLLVSMFANTVSGSLDNWAYGSLFDRETGTSDFIKLNVNSNANDEVYIAVVDRTGAISGTANTVLEKFVASKATNARDPNNNSLYYKDVLLNKSRYVYQTGHPTGSYKGTFSANGWGVAANSVYIFSDHDSANTSYPLANGSYVAVTAGNVTVALDVLNDPTVDVSLIMTGAHSSAVVQYAISSVADYRKDCLVFVSPTYANCTSTQPEVDIPAYRTAIGSFSSYGVMDSGWKYIYDKYYDTYRWVPLNGDVAGMCAKTDSEREPWFSPAGPVRGQVKNIVKLAYNPDLADRNILYKADVNPVVSFNGEGTYLFGDKTMLGRTSAFSRINVRRLFMVLEKTISRAAKASLFEFNDEFTRAQFISIVDPYLRSVLAGRGIYDYRVICDERNNPPDLIDRNEFVGDIYIKPAKSINFIQLNFVAIRTGVQFEEVIGRATV